MPTMSRWFTAILYALMFVCAALPASAQERAVEQHWVQAEASDAGSEVGFAGLFDVSESSGTGGLVLAEELQADGMLEVPELFDGPRVPTLARRIAIAPPGPSAAVPPPPFLKGPQRPPRTLAVLTA